MKLTNYMPMFRKTADRHVRAEREKVHEGWHSLYSTQRRHWHLWVDKLKGQLRDQAVLEDQLNVLDKKNRQLNDDNAALHSWLNDANTELERLNELHSKHTRVVTWNMDPLRLNAQLRQVEASLRVEREGNSLFVYSDRPLSESQVNAVNAILLEPANKT